MKKYIAEMLGTFVLVFIGCGTVVFASRYVGSIGVALAFGLALTTAAYTFGPISGAHVNPAVTLGFLSSGRMKLNQAMGYIVFQFIGALLATAVVYMIAKGRATGYTLEMGLGQNGWGNEYAGQYSAGSAFWFEFIATFIFVKVVLKTTACDLKITGVVIGLTLAAIHILGMPITGVSVNPARSFGPAIMTGGTALHQLWLFLLAPSLAGLLAGICDLCCNCSCNIQSALAPKVAALKAAAPKVEAKPAAKPTVKSATPAKKIPVAKAAAPKKAPAKRATKSRSAGSGEPRLDL
ncbi:MAG: aquaporin [Alphaproteobacteria bacterium]|nr:aquaporin [Alphaproteobacteria bacterium]